MTPSAPAAAYDEFLREQAPAGRARHRWTQVHGLPYLTRDNFLHGTVPSWQSEFDEWAADALARGDVDALAGYRDVAPAARFAHPTAEHYLPLFVTLGAATDAEAPVRTTVDGFWAGLSKRSFQVD